jgi:hypothetical protein
MPLTLPTEKTKPKLNDPRILLMYSVPKCGKTVAVSLLPNCLIIDLEEPAGTEFVECFNIRVKNFLELQEVWSLLKKNNPYKYVVIDSITRLEKFAEDRATQDYKQSNMGKNFTGNTVLELTSSEGYSPGYRWLREAFNRYISAFSRVAPNLILIGHVRETQINKDSKVVSSKDLDLYGKSRQYVCANSDAIAYVYRDLVNDKILRMNFRTNENVVCGSRCEHLKGQDIEVLKFDNSKENKDKLVLVENNWNKVYTELNNEL